MSAEIICVGTEILLGDIVNTNAQYLARELADLGIPHYFQSTVGDNRDRLHQTIRTACTRASILIFTGGLGPTPDDLTHEAIASYFQTPLSERPEIIEDIAAKFAARGRTMTDNNRKQALLPEGAEVLPNPGGTAPGIVWQPQDDLWIFTFPGVPSEMRQMWRETAVLALKAQGWGKEILYRRMLRFWGIGESALAAKVNPFFDSTNPTVAPYASQGMVKLRVAAKAESEAAAMKLIEPVAEKLQAIAGADYFGSDEETLASVVGELLRDRQQTLSVAESCTGGGLGQLLTETPGSSDYFLGGIISYSNAVKIFALGVRPESLQQFGAVSESVAREMALGVRESLGSNWSLSITGIAGPEGGSEEKPVGLVYIALAAPDGNTEVFEYRFGERPRTTIRDFSAKHALDRLRRKLLSDLQLSDPLRQTD